MSPKGIIGLREEAIIPFFKSALSTSLIPLKRGRIDLGREKLAQSSPTIRRKIMNFKILVVRMGFLLRILSNKPQEISESPKERDLIARAPKHLIRLSPTR